MIKIDSIMGSSEEFKMQERVLNIILFLGSIIALLAGITNIITNMPFYNYCFPLITAVIGSGIYILSRKVKKTYLAKIIFIIFLDFIYAPLGWLTTAGSLSAIVYYSILFFLITFLLIEKPWEYIFPCLYIQLIIYLMYIETKYPDHFDVYSSPFNRFKDISVHYTIITIIITAITVILRYKYTSEHLKYIKLSTTDELTGLYNRRYVMQRLKEEFKNSKVNNNDFCIIMIDVDNFKKANDIYGHQSGDNVLVKLANILITNSRNTDICGRYGGDEFIVILPNCTENSAKQYIERVKQTFNEFAKSYSDAELSISVGISDNRLSSENEIIKNADCKLYTNKKMSKKNKI